jgi:hypothetical protein
MKIYMELEMKKRLIETRGDTSSSGGPQHFSNLSNCNIFNISNNNHELGNIITSTIQ